MVAKKSATATKAAPAKKTVKVGLAYDIGGRGDKSFNDGAYAGADSAWGLPDSVIDGIVSTGIPFRVETKYWMEQMGLPFHPTHINTGNQRDRRHSRGSEHDQRDAVVQQRGEQREKAQRHHELELP